MRSYRRNFDPQQQVRRSLEDRRGIISQADIIENKKAVARIAGLGDEPERIDRDSHEMGALLLQATDGQGFVFVVLAEDGTTRFAMNSADFGIPDLGQPQNNTANFVNGMSLAFYSDDYTTGTIALVNASGTIIASGTIQGADLEATNSLDVGGAANVGTLNVVGDLTVGGTVGGASPNRWLSGAHKDPGATTITAVGMTAWTTAATVTSADDSTGSWLNSTPASVTGTASGPNGTAAYRPDWGIDCTFRIRTGTTATNVRYWVGLCASDPSGSSSPAVDQLAFRFDTGAGDTGWSVRTRSATGANTNQDVATLNSGTPYLLRILATDTEVNYYVDGVLVQTHNTPANIPATTLLAPYVRITVLANVARSLGFGTFNALSK